MGPPVNDHQATEGFGKKDVLEVMSLEIEAGKDKFLLATCYRQPRGNYTPHFWDELQASYNLATTQGIRDIILVGDFNADASSNTVAGRHLEEFLSTNNLFQHITEPTRVTDDGEGTKLDLLITNHRNVVLQTESLDRLHTNDHNTISGLLQFKTQQAKSYTRQMWDFTSANFDKFRDELNKVDWESCFVTQDANIAANKWTELFLATAKRTLPTKPVTIRPNDQKWYNGYLRRLCRQKDRIFRRVKHNRLTLAWENYKKLRNNYFAEVRRLHAEHENKNTQALADEAALNPKK